MKLKPTVKAKQVIAENSVKKEAEKKSKKAKELPSDVYQPMFPPKRFLVREVPSQKDGSPQVLPPDGRTTFLP